MRIVCEQSELLNGINIVLKAVPTRTTMPILQCIIIRTADDSITLTTNNMELGIETRVHAEITEPGAIALDAKFFSDIVRRIPNSQVTIQTNEFFNASIVCEKSKFDISGKPTDEFPSLPTVSKDRSVVMSQFALRELIRQTIFSISNNENNALMTGEYLEIEENRLRMISLDGHRISIRRMELDQDYGEISAVIPGRSLSEVSKILSGEQEDLVAIFFAEKHMLFEFESTVVVTRLIEGTYYKVDTMLSGDYQTRITLPKRALQESLDRCCLLVGPADKKPIIMNIADRNLNIRCNTPIGSMNEDIEIDQEGKDLMIGFNPYLILDALRVIDDEMIDIYLFNQRGPAFIRRQDDSYLYLILPVNFNAADV